MHKEAGWGRDSHGDDDWLEQEGNEDDESPDDDDHQDDDVTGDNAANGGTPDEEGPDGTGADNDAGGTDETAGNDYSQFEEFKADLKMLEEYNEQNVRYATRELDDVRAEIFLDRVNVDLEAAKAKVREFLQYRHQQYERIHKMPPDKASTWMLEDQIHQRGLALHQRMTLQAAGLDGEVLFDLMDDHSHLIDDSTDRDGREMRKHLKEQMRQLSRDEREDLLIHLLERGEIDDQLFNHLHIEFC